MTHLQGARMALLQAGKIVVVLRGALLHARSELFSDFLP